MSCVCLILFFLTIHGVVLAPVARARSATVSETSPVGVAPESSPVGVVPEEPESSRVTLKLAGGTCDINAVESTLLRLQGVVGVDIESKKGHLIVDYTSSKLTPQQMVDALARKKGCQALITP